MLKKLIEFGALFGSLGTIVCCALPALLVTLGMGATFASLISTFPQLIWLSENKGPLFLICGILLGISGYLQIKNRYAACPADPRLAKACMEARLISRWVYGVSLGLFLIGVLFAYVLPNL